MEIPAKTLSLDGKSYPVAEAQGGAPVWDVRAGQRLEKEFGFGGSMGEVRCTHEGVCNGFYFAEGFDVTDGTARLHPLITTVGARYTGTFDTAGGVTLTDDDADFPTSGRGLIDYVVTITGGTGAGAHRTITGNTQTTLTVATLTTSTNSTYDVSVLGSLAYSPLAFFEDFDVAGLGATYCQYRDCSTTPDIIITKVRQSNDVPVDREISAAAASATCPRIGRAEDFNGALYITSGDGAGTNVMRKLATVGDIATAVDDTWENADASTWAYACAGIMTATAAKFVRATINKIALTDSEPKTLALYEVSTDIGDTSDDIVWLSETSDGLIAVHSTFNLWLFDPDKNAYSVLPFTRHVGKRWRQTYDEFDGHMGAPLSAGVLHPTRSGLWFYQTGRLENAALDQIGKGTLDPYRAVPNISNIPIGLRHYACVTFGDWIYAIYKPTGSSNSANVHILYGFYVDGQITWRTLITQNKDIIGLFIDARRTLNWIYDPQPQTDSPGTPTAEWRYITLNADGSPKTTLGVNRGAASTTYTYYFPEIDFDLPYIQKQLRLMTLESENFPTAGGTGVTVQLGVYRDGGSTTTIGATITTAGNNVTERSPTTLGTNDAAYRFRPYLTLITGATYAPTTSDPRLLRLKIEGRSVDIIRTILLPSAQRNLFETKKILRKLKNAGFKTVREPETNETFSGQIVAVNDIIHNNLPACEVIMERWGVAS